MDLRYQYEPQLCLRVKDEKLPDYHLSNDYVSDIKMDGARYILHYGLDGEARAYSRSTSVHGGLVDKSGQLKHLLLVLMRNFPRGTVLDGEVFLPGMKKSFKHVTRITGCTPEEAYARQLRSGIWLNFYNFDMLAYDGQDYTVHGNCWTQMERWSKMFQFYAQNGKLGEHFQRCRPVSGEINKAEHLKECLEQGYEGTVLKNLGATYSPGKRDKRWVKVKPQRDYSVVIVGVEWANLESIKKGETSSTPTRFVEMARSRGFNRIVGAIKYGQLVRSTSLIDEGELYTVDGSPYHLKQLGKCSGIDDSTRLDITANWEHYRDSRRVFDLRAQNRHEETLALREPQFDRWRDDLSISNCIVEEE